jgi:pyrimidine-nucleoside phosphorylase
VSRSIEDLLAAMKSGRPVPDADIVAFVEGVVAERFTRPQIAAWLAWAWARTLTPRETLALTRAMTETGELLRWDAGAELVDKHSTGGVGDKVSLVLAPLWATLGRRVPMISGRGLGHTGGTLDKLEAIPGTRCDLSTAELRAVLADVGCFISGQTAQLAPADRVLYALRDEISAVDSEPLIVASILCKKLAEGLDRLVLDVKVGSGAFMRTVEAAEALARAMVEVAAGAGVDCAAMLTDMNQPLGRAVGNALEVAEAVDCLQGGGPPDLRELVVTLADDPRAADVLASGAAFETFQRMVAAQGGDPRALEDRSRLHGRGTAEHVVKAERDGVVAEVDALSVGRAAFELGAGRRAAGAPLDFGAGVTVHARIGDRVVAGQPLLTLHHRDGRGLAAAQERLCGGLVLADGPVARPPLVLGVVRSSAG